MNIDFLAPGWLLLILPATYLWWRWRNSNRKLQTLRIILLLIIISALAQPRLAMQRRGGVLVVVADRSSSMPANAAEREKEIIRLIEKEKGNHDRIAIVGFAENVHIEQVPEPTRFNDFIGYYAGHGSRLTSALQTAETIIPKDRNGRILLLSDGRFTGLSPLTPGILSEGNIPIDYRDISRQAGSDPAIISLSPPLNVEPGEAFQFSAELILPEASRLTYRLSRSGEELASGETALAAGRQQLLFQDRLHHAGNVRYRLEIATPLEDPFPENNRAEAVVTVHGKRPLLHVGSDASRLPKLAEAGELSMVHLNPGQMQWDIEGISRFRGIILENISANKLGYLGQDALSHFIEDLGGGLMITGGRQSFGLGGYFNTPLGEQFPVSMELRREHRKLSTAVVIALDRSGSMGVHVQGGMNKMDLANQGTVAALDLLSDNDQIGVIAVDSQAHIINELSDISGRREQIAKRIRAIKSMGGGIFIYEALSHSAEMIAGASAGTRHIILFADAADSEEPGKYRELLAKLRDAGVTVSVIGLGSEKDIDAELLKDIAARGGGNIYFTNSAKELPQLFAQETLSVFRASFVEEETAFNWAEDIPLIANIPEGTPPPIGGYNLCYLRPGASSGAVSNDEFSAPILAFWNKGNGRCIAFTGEVDGKFSGPFGASAQAGALYLSCMRWINQSAEDCEDCFIRTERHGDQARINIALLPERQQEPFQEQPKLIILHESTAGIERKILPFAWVGRDSLAAQAQIPPDGTSHFYIEIESRDGVKRLVHGGAMCMPYPPEFKPETEPGRGRVTISRLAAISGGQERISLDGIFSDIPPFRRLIPVWHILALAALIILVMEVIGRRIGLPEFKPYTKRKRRQKRTDSQTPAIPTDADPQKQDRNSSGSVLGAIETARRKTRGR